MNRARVKYSIRHETRYRYDADVVHSHHLLHLVPRPASYQQCLEHEISIEPAVPRRANECDAFGNPVLRIELAQPHRELTVVSRMQIEVHARPAVSADTTESWEKVRDAFAYNGGWPSRERLDSGDAAGQEARAALARQIAELTEGASALSDRLSRRYFALIDSDSHALAT